MSNAVVRAAAAHDRDAIVSLVLELNRYENAISGDRTTDADSAARRYAEHLETLRRDASAALMVAERRERVVGYLFFVVETRPVFVREEWRRVGYISELCVAAGARDTGVGSALLRAAESHARRIGVSHLGLTALAGNAVARTAYARQGFGEYAIEFLKPLAD